MTMISKAPKMAISSQFSESEMPSRALLDNFNNNNSNGMMSGKLITAIKVAEFSPCAAIHATKDRVEANPIAPKIREIRYSGILPTGFPITHE